MMAPRPLPSAPKTTSILALGLLLSISHGPTRAGGLEDTVSDPRAYIVPEAFRSKARALVDPGGGGLPGGLVLKDVALGLHVRATYVGPPGTLVVEVLPIPVAPDDIFWRGRRVALRVARTTVEAAAQDEALARLKTIVAEREKGWGWLQRPPARAKEVELRNAAHAGLHHARRLAWLGDAAGSVRRVQAEVKRTPKDLSVLLQASRIVHLTGRRSVAHGFGQRAFDRATRSAAVKGLQVESRDRLRLVLASAAALAGRADAAWNVSRKTIADGRVACRIVRAAADLERAGDGAMGRRVLEELNRHVPSCEPALALAVDLARREGDHEGARAHGEAGLKAKPDSLAVRSALARLDLVAGRLDDAFVFARTATHKSRGRGDGLVTLAAVIGEGGGGDAEYESWQGEAARSPQNPAALGLGALGCLGLGDLKCAAEGIEKHRAVAPGGDQVSALHAWLLARIDQTQDAQATLDLAWSETTVGPSGVAAEAELAEARGETRRAIRLWEIYRVAVSTDPGPVTAAYARVRMASLESVDAPDDAPGSEPPPAGSATATQPKAASTGDEPPGAPVWPWIVGVVLALLSVGLLLRRPGAGSRRE